MGAGLVEPEDSRVARGPRARHGKAHPVLDGGVLDRVHAPDVARFDIVRHEHLARGLVNDAHHACGLLLKGVRVRAVLLGLLRHETDVGDVAHGAGVELPVGTAVVHDGLVEPRIAAVRDDALCVFERVVSVPHTARVADHVGHRRIDDNVRGHVQVGDALARVDHGQLGARVVHGHDVGLDLGLHGVPGQLVVDVAEPVVRVDAELGKEGRVLLKDILIVDLDDVTEHDRIGHLHHSGLEVQRQHNAGLLGVCDLLLEERHERLDRHARRVDNLTRLQRHARFHLGHGAAIGRDVLDAHRDWRLSHRVRLLGLVKVATRHVCDVRATVRRPRAHLFRVGLRVRLDGGGYAPVRVALAQHRVDGAAEHVGVLVLGVLVVRDVVPLLLQLGNALKKLRD
mmetsp:Transcript_101188/g.246099  ORF Transcript_101188/g.246099 Transcript_101188/m.246099 type:complete len:398 (-) Transcript_101188:336-1529(-)